MTSVYKSRAGKELLEEKYREIQGKISFPFKDIIIESKYAETHIVAAGEEGREPVLLLHGSASNALALAETIKQLSANFQVYAIDIPGEPGLSEDKRLPATGNTISNWLKDIIGKLDLDKVNILGYSMGGWFALKLAGVYPEVIKKMLLISPAGIVNPRFKFLLTAIMNINGGAKGIEKLNRYVLGDCQVAAETMAYMNLIGSHFNPRMDLNTLTDDELREITSPCLLLGGGKDNLNNCYKIARRMKKIMPFVEDIILENRGHVIDDVWKYAGEFFG